MRTASLPSFPRYSPRGARELPPPPERPTAPIYIPGSGVLREGVEKNRWKMDENKGIYSEKERDKLIKAELRRLNGIFEDIDERRRKTVSKLIENAAFLAMALDELQKIIKRDGYIESYQNGANQKGLKKSSAVDTYDRYLSSYSKIVKQLCDLLPQDVSKEDPAEDILKYIKAS